MLIARSRSTDSGVVPSLGGLLVDHASYRWIFWVGGAMAVIAAAAARLLPEPPPRKAERLDLAGTALLAVGVTAPLIALSQGRAWGWRSGRTLGLIAAGVLVLAVFALAERRAAAPLVDLPLSARPPVLMTNLATLLVGFGMFGALVLILELAQAPASSGYGFGADATPAGLLMVPGTLIMRPAGVLAGALARRFHGRWPLALGGLISAAGLAMLAAQHGSPAAVLGWTTVLFTGIGLLFAAIPSSSSTPCRPPRRARPPA